jgi:F1F0 ATPase subunit 2
MTQSEMIALGLIAGVALGVVFFGGLRLTMARMNRTRNVALLTVFSFVARSLIGLAGLFLVVRFLGLAGIVSALLGFIAMQIVFVRLSMKGTATRCPK